MSDETAVTVVFVTNGDKAVSAAMQSSLLRVSMREKGGIPWKCGAGLCGTCRCHVEGPTDAVKPRERKHLTDADIAAGMRMACQTFVLGDVRVSWQALGTAPP